MVECEAGVSEEWAGGLMVAVRSAWPPARTDQARTNVLAVALTCLS